MSLVDRVRENFKDSLQVHQLVVGKLVEPVSVAGKLLAKCLKNGNKIISCGNGGSACDAEHFTAELMNRFQIDRPSLPAVTLNCNIGTITSIANDYDYSEVFAKQLRALAKAGDVLLAISTSGNSSNILKAIHVAHELNLYVIFLTGETGGKANSVLRSKDIGIYIPTDVTPRIQEAHISIIHCFCDVIDYQLFLKE